MNYSYTENASGITKRSNAWECLARCSAPAEGLHVCSLTLSFTRAFIHRNSGWRKNCVARMASSLIDKPVARTKTLAKESGDEKPMVTVPNCLVKIYQGQPRGALADITKKWGPTFPQKEHIPPIPRLHSYIQITAQRPVLSGCQTQNSTYMQPTRKQEPSDWGLVFLQRWLLVRAAFAWLKQLQTSFNKKVWL